MEIPSISINIIRTPTTEYWKVPGEDILYGNILPGAFLDVDDVKENALRRSELLDVNRPIPSILDITKIDKITKDARKESSAATDGISAIAIIVDSGLSKIIGNYAIMLNRPAVPIRLFTSVTDARFWARDYMPNDK